MQFETISSLEKKFGISQARFRVFLKDTSPDLVIGKSKGYKLSTVQRVVREAHNDVLDFLAQSPSSNGETDI
jgi:hypothetical protein